MSKLTPIFSPGDLYVFVHDVRLMTSHELTSGSNLWSRVHLYLAVMHLLAKFGANIYIQSLDISRNFIYLPPTSWMFTLSEFCALLYHFSSSNSSLLPPIREVQSAGESWVVDGTMLTNTFWCASSQSQFVCLPEISWQKPYKFILPFQRHVLEVASVFLGRRVRE